MRRFLLALLLTIPLRAAMAEALWQTLPPTPPPVPGEHTGHAKVNGISLYYATIGHGPPVVLLHGGLANSDYWGNQVRALAPHHTVIVMDSRGHGRSTRDARPYGYDLMADDVVALLDTLQSPRPTSWVGATARILGLDLAIRHPDRVGKVFAFAANTVTSRRAGRRREEPDLRAFHRARRAANTRGCRRRRRTTMRSSRRSARCGRPSRTGPMRNCKSIRSPVLVVDGDHDEAIKRAHTEYIAATIPGAGLLILPNTSHFAFLQDPALFNAALLHFLGDR